MKTAPAFPFPSRYKFNNEVLKGGQGAVYICHDEILCRPVAIKTLHNAKDVAGLTKEIDARAKITSKHVAELYEHLVDSGKNPVALVMEYVPGTSLAEAGALPSTPESRLLLAYQLACGISDIHLAGVIHRDIKPGNMKVDGAGILKIFDLGIANLNADTAKTVGGAGTMVYAAPEIYTAPVKVTTAADVYALGVTAWYLTGHAFPAALLEIPPQSKTRLSISIRDIAPEFGDAALLLDLALSLDPNDRPQARAIRDALARQITHATRRGMFSLSNGTFHELKKIGSTSNIKVLPFGTLSVGYTSDGRFIVKAVTGDVFINNVALTVGSEVPDSCVITFGPPSAGAHRSFLTFDVSQPEIVL